MNDYSFRIEEKPKYIIGYHQLLDELFLFNIDSDGIVSVFRQGKLDSMFFEEFTSSAPWISLGEL